jgi:acetoin utilization protein AcuA
MPGIYEVGIDVARDWRGIGIGRKLLQFALDRDSLEDLVLIAMGLSWHWDLSGDGAAAAAYRDRIVRLFSAAGFRERITDDPEIATAPANVFLARVGRRVPQERVAEFERSLLRERSDWWGF